MKEKKYEFDFEAIFNKCEEAILIADDDANYVLVNQAACDLLGFTEEELLQKNVFDIIPIIERKTGRKMWQDFIAKGNLTGEFKLSDSQDDLKFIKFTATANIQPHLHMSILHDITPAEDIKKKAQAEEKLLHKIAENYPHSYVSIIEKDLTIGYTAGQELKKTGLDSNKFIGLDLKKVFGEHEPVVKDHYLKTFQGEEQLFELFINEQNQLYKTVPLTNEAGEIDQILVVVENLSDRKLAERELAEQRENLNAVFENTSDLIWSADKNYRLLIANKNFLKFVKPLFRKMITPGTLLIDNKILPDNIFKEWKQLFDIALSGNKVSRMITFNPDQKNESFLDMHLSPIRNEKNETTGLSILARDITAIKRQETELKESEEKFRSITEQMKDVIFLTDDKGIITYISPASENIFGRKPEEMEGRSFTEFLAKEDIPRATQKYRKAVTSGESSKFLEFLMKHKTGNLFYGELVSRIYSDQDQTVTVGVIRDISEKKAAEIALKQSENKFRLLVDKMPAGLYLTDVNGKCTYVNPGWMKMTGLKLEEALGDGWKEGIHPADRERVFQNWQKMISSKDKWDHEYRVGTENKYRWVNARALEIHNEKDVIVGYLGINSDITELKRTEQDLALRESRYRTLLENVSAGIGYYDPEGTVILFNNMAAELMGGEPADFIGKSIYQLYGDEPGKIYHDRIKAAVEADSFMEYEDRVDLPAGIKWFNSKYNKIHNQEKEIIGVQVISTDITDIIETQKILQDSRDRYRNFVENSGEGIYRIELTEPVPVNLPEAEFIKLVDKNAVISEINNTLAEMYGLKVKDMLNKSAILFAPDYGKRVFEILDKPDYKVSKINTQDTDRRGNIIHLTETYHGVVENDKLIRIWGVQRNITDIVQTQKMLQESETLYREIFQSSKDGYMTVEGPDWKFTSANQAVLDQFKLNSQEEFLNMTPWELSPPTQSDGRSSEEKAKDMIMIAVKDGYNYFEWTHRRSNGEDFYATVLLNRIDLDGRSFILAIVRDITENKISRLQLEESENRYRSLFEHSTDPILLIEDYTFIECNTATLKFMGYNSKDEIFGKKPWDISPKKQPDGMNSKEKAKKVIKEALNRGYSRFEWLHLNNQGNEVWVDVALTFVKIKGKGFIYTVWRDINKRKEAEIALEENRKRLELTLAGANIGLWDMDFTTGHIYRSKEWLNMLGYNKDEIEPTIDFWLNLIHPDDTDSIISVDQVVNDRSISNFENEQRLKCKDGTYKWVHNWGQIIERDDNDKALRALGIHMNIDERKKAEIALEKSNKRLQMILTGANLGFWDVDFQANTAYRSPEWAIMLGYEPDEIEDTIIFWSDLIHPEDKNNVVKIREEYQELQDNYFHSEQRLKCKDGSYKWIFSWGQIVEWDESGQPLRAVGIHMDVDTLKRNEENLINMMSLLKATLESTADGILVVDLEGRIVNCNSKFFDIWKISEDILPEGKIKDLVAPENTEYAMKHILNQLIDPQAFIEKVHSLYEKPASVSFDILTFKDGRIVERYSKPQLLNGKPVGRVWSFRDISSHKTTERILRNSELLNRTVIEESPIGISVRDINGTLLLCNNAWQSLWGLTDDEVEAYKKPRKNLLFNDKDVYLGENMEAIKKVYTEGGSFEIPELKLKKIRANKAEWISQYFYAIMNDRREVDRVVILTNDITQNKKAQLELIQYRDHLEELVKERTAELEKKNADLKRYNKLFVGREFRIKELKGKIAELETRLKKD